MTHQKTHPPLPLSTLDFLRKCVAFIFIIILHGATQPLSSSSSKRWLFDGKTSMFTFAPSTLTPHNFHLINTDWCTNKTVSSLGKCELEGELWKLIFVSPIWSRKKPTRYSKSDAKGENICVLMFASHVTNNVLDESVAVMDVFDFGIIFPLLRLIIKNGSAIDILL